MVTNMKKYLLLGAIVLIITITGVYISVVKADTLGPLGPGTTVDSAATGTISWVNPNNAQASDNVYATATGGNSISKSHYLNSSNFSFSIPTNATISGILVEIQKKVSGTSLNVKDVNVNIIKSSGTLGTQNKADTVTGWPTSEAYTSYGSASDLWGETWTPADINNSNFGVAVSAALNGVGGPSCLSPDTLINTPNGKIKIKDLQPGDPVYSYSEKTGKIERDIATKVESEPISIDNNEYIVIKTADGNTIRATASHVFFVDGDWVTANDLKVGDLLLSSALYKTKIVSLVRNINTTDQVWNIGVKNNHDFFANDVLVHNGSAAVANIDFIRITVTYTAAAASQSATSMMMGSSF